MRRRPLRTRRGWPGDATSRSTSCCLRPRGDRLALARQEYRHPLTQVEAIALHEVTADGALAQCGVIFDVEDEDAAYAELDARAAALEASSDDGRPAENAASRHTERFHAAVSSGDAEAIGRLLAPDTVVDDRRRLVGIRMSPESSFESARLLVEFDGLTLTGEPVATRGQRLVLLQQQFVHRSRAVVETMTVHEVDESGELLDLAVMFDPEDEDAAWEELDARVRDVRATSCGRSSVVSPITTRMTSTGSVRGSTLTAFSRTTLRWGGDRSRRREYLVYCRSLFELTDEARVRALEIVVAERWGFLTRFRMSGRRDGGYFAQDALIVTGLRDEAHLAARAVPDRATRRRGGVLRPTRAPRLTCRSCGSRVRRTAFRGVERREAGRLLVLRARHDAK